MATDATGGRPGPTPPSARRAAKTQSAGRPLQRAGNGSPPKSLFRPPPAVGARQSGGSGSRVTSAASSPIATEERKTIEARDELVRAVMPQLRMLVEQLVKTEVDRSLASVLERQKELEATIERSIAPLLDKQRELEATIEDLQRTQRHPPPLPAAAAAQRTPTPSSGSVHAEERPLVTPSSPVLSTENVAPRPIAIERPAAAPPTAMFTTAYDANVLAELPAELNGSRRKRMMIWLLVIAVLMVLLSATGLSLLSHTGRYL